MKITPSDIALLAGLLLTFLNIIDRGHMMKMRTQKPHKELEIKVAKLETELEKVERMLNNDNTPRIENLEDGGRIIIKSMGALLSHAIDGNNISEMQRAREELNEYLLGGGANGHHRFN